MTILEKVDEVCLDNRHKRQLMLLLRMSYAAGMGHGVSLGMESGPDKLPNIGHEYIPIAFNEWASTFPWFSIDGL